LRKAESTVLVQRRTGRIGLKHFLKKARVPGYESGQCTCGTGQETPRHVLLEFSDEEERREVLREIQGQNLDLRKLLDTEKRAQGASRWMIKSGRIAKFRLASQLLYEEEGE
jgi:hypothetical protein